MSSFEVFLPFILKFKLFGKCFPFQNVMANLPLCDGMCLSITESVSEGLLYEEKNSQHKTVIYL